MSEIKIHVLQTGSVCVAPDLPFGGDHTNLIKALESSAANQTGCGCRFLCTCSKVRMVSFCLTAAGTVI